MSDPQLARISLLAEEDTVRNKRPWFPPEMLDCLLDWVILPSEPGTAPIAFGHKELGRMLELAESESRSKWFGAGPSADREFSEICGYQYSEGGRQRTVETGTLVEFARHIAQHAINQYKAIGEDALHHKIAVLEFDLKTERNYTKALRRRLSKHEKKS